MKVSKFQAAFRSELESISQRPCSASSGSHAAPAVETAVPTLPSSKPTYKTLFVLKRKSYRQLVFTLFSFQMVSKAAMERVLAAVLMLLILNL